ncbi:MAG TPA: amino acid adenylation domain-containing protein, partial [Longimicrobiaceae bacterium]
MSAPPGAGSPFADRLDLLALLLAEEEDAAPLPEAPRIRPREPGTPAPLSFGQLRLWFLDRLDPGTSVYNVPLAWRLRGALDADALERALAETVRRHEALRTVFAPGGEEPVQTVLPEGGFALRREDLSAAPAEAAPRVREEAERPFDLSAGPLFRATLFRLAPDEHVLLLVWHHAVSDGWSVDVVRAEAAALYGAFLRGEPSPLPPLPVQYADYALWQREHLGDEEVQRQLDWWRAQLDGAPPVLELATDRPRSAAREHRGARVAFAAGEGTLAGLAALAREESATSFMTTLAAFQLFLAKQAGMDDVVVGTPIANRPLPELEGLVGFFVNTLALRTDLSGDPTFRELLRRVRETVLGAFAHQDLPFERLVQELAPDRTLAHAPLVQAVFSQGGSSGGAPPPFAGLEATRERVWDPPAKFDLTMTVQELGGALRGELLYDADLFDAATAERMSERFVALLDHAAATPDARLSDFTLLTDAERRTVLEEWNRTGRDLPPDTVHGAFAEQAARTPDAVALIFGGETVTYAELDRRSGELAGRLAALGVGPDVRVGVCAERSPELVAAMLGVLRAGGAYLPLDPGYPAERLAWMLADAGAPVLLAQEGLAGLFSGFGGRVVLLGEGGAGGAPGPTAPVTPDGLAYVIYTSGSTGRPKGTAVPHRAIPGFFREVDYARFDAGEVFLQHSSVSWDAFALELWPALLTGAKCVLLPARASEPELLAEQVREHGVTTLWLSSAYFNLVVDTLPGALAGVRQVMVGGEAVSAAHVRRAREAHPGLRVVNGYGPSECTVFTTCWPVPAGFDGAVVPIGRPVGDRRVHLLDGDGAPVPAGVPGELHVGGPAVARGYLGRPALTAEKFVPDPFSGEAGARLYRTGDRARWRPDGTLEFLGRMDAQAKLRGFRVEPGEVEAALAEHPGVRESAVVVREDALVAYVVPADGERTASAELRAWLRERLPDYLVPSAFAFLDALPLTPHGKLDRRALPAPETDAGAAYEPPATPTEEAVAAIFAEVLRVERVGARDHFFERGGHSLLATRAVSRVRESLGVELPLRALFEAPTPAELAARIDAEAGAGAGAGAPPLLPADRSAPLPLSFAQERMWVLQQIDPESRAYNVPVGLRLRGPLDAGALGRALAALVERHESLRTVFPVMEGAPVQAVAPFTGFALPVEDLTALPETDREAEALRRAREASLRRYDLAEGPLFHAALLRLGAADHLLSLGMHHVVVDGWSLDVLFRELEALYGAFARGEPSPLAPLPVQYADFAAWQRGWLAGETLERQLAFWSERLREAPPVLDLPTDRPRPQAPSGRRATREAVLPEPLATELRALARREGATLFMTTLAGFQALLGRYAGQDDVLVGTPAAGRDRVELEGLVGFFVNTLVLRADLSGDPAGRALLAQARERTLEAQAHADLPFERLVDALGVERSLSHTPLFQVMFSLVASRGRERLRLEGVEAETVRVTEGETPFDLSLVVVEQGDRLLAAVDFQAELFDPATVERMTEHLRVLLEGMAARPETPVSALPLLPAAERARVVVEWNATERPYPRGESVHRLVARQASLTPGAPAVLWDGGALTFAELEARAGRLARVLVRHGVGPEARVGICLDRSPEMLAAVLAVLGAGGAYVPLDPDYPAERLEHMLGDSGARVVVTRRELAGALPASAHDVVLVDDLEEGTDDVDAPEPAVDAESAAYVIYTSGSTGTPRGVLVPHRALVAHATAAREEYGIGPADRVLQFASLSFDASVEEIYPALLGGAALVLRTTEMLASAASFLAAVAERGVTVLDLPTAFWHELVAELERGEAEVPACVRLVIIGGERALPERVAAWHARVGPSVRLVNTYGPTEATVVATAAELEAGAPVTIGAPVPNARAYVLDARLAPVPIGVRGELYLGGAGVARGYLGRPDATAERFLPDPFAAEAGARMYRSGDVARWRAEGRLEFVGRADAQVKVRGFRVEPAEVEGVLLRHRAVRDAAVMAREDEPGRVRLVGYVVAEGEEAPTVAELRAWVKASLPEHMVPSAWVALDALPLTPSGKTDLRALPAPDAARAGDGYVAPRTQA